MRISNTRKATNWWGSAKRDDTHPRTTVVLCSFTKTIQGYTVVNFEVTSSSSFRDIPTRLFCDGEDGDGSGGMNAICGRLDVAAGYVISGEDEQTVREYVCTNCALRASVVCE